MSKRSIRIEDKLYCGIDVDAESLTVLTQRAGQPCEQRSFPKNPIGIAALILLARYQGAR